MTMQKKECIELIKSFIAERLDGNIQKFYDYDLDQLEKDEKYGAYDPDNSRIANAIYIVLWGNKVPNLTMNNLGGEMYRGDTMNSFNTLMGRPNEDGTSFLGVQKYTHDSEIINIAKKYYEKYHTLGNMMILPNKKLESARTTLNLLRGGGPWYDYFDLFLSDIKNLMVGTNIDNVDDRLKELVKINKDFFDCFRGIDGFKHFCKTFYLDKYVNLKSLKVCDIFSPHARHWPTKYSEEEYKKYVVTYITNATEIIDYRCGRMIEALEEEIIKYDSTFKVSSKFNEQESHSQSVNEKFENTTKVKKESLKDKFKRQVTAKTEKLKEKIVQFNKEFKEDSRENIALFLVGFNSIIGILYSIFLFVKFLILDGYNQDSYLVSNPGDLYFNNSFLSMLFIIFFGLSVFLMGISYVKKHTGIRKILMIAFIILQILIYVIPLVFGLIMRIITYLEWFIRNYFNDVQTIKVIIGAGIKIYGIACVLSIILSFVMFMFESNYRLFVKRWIQSFLICFLLVPLILTLLAYKIIAYLSCFAIIVYILIGGFGELHYARKHRCHSCGKFSGLERVSNELVKEVNISMLVKNEVRDESGKVTGRTEQYIPGIRKVFVQAFYCQNCGYVENRTVTKDIKCI